ncbi:hypothetical protein RIF29_40609 [Crotalaria pallida]|uniref:F-box domain-containing protein n=1 Tax=Crotalaria pallida TaxID=3830 RepID=A0AAN9HNM0_CROPI
MVHISLVDANDNPLENDVVEETTKNTSTTTKRWRFATSSNTQTLTSPPKAHGDLSHDPFPTLPYELNTEIISRLPVKILMQFKCINKPWKTLISDPQFARKHLSKVNSTHLILSFSNPSHEFLVKSYSLKSMFESTKSMFESTTPIPEELEYPLRTRNHLGNESCQELSQPVYGIDVVNLTLGVLRNCLCTLAYSGTFSDVWLMKDYGDNKSWAKLFRIPPYMEDVDSFPYLNVLCISEDEEVLLEYNSKKIVVYNIRNETFRIIEIQYLVNGWAVPHLHVESLISPFF